MKKTIAALALAGFLTLGTGVASASAAPTSPSAPDDTDSGGGIYVDPEYNNPTDSPTPFVNSCDTWRNAVAIPGGYRNSVAGCTYIGTTNSTAVFYKWERTGGSNKSQACVQGKGFNSLRNPVWQNAGCGTSGSTALLWGNVLASKQIRMFASAGLTVNLNWR